MTFKNDPRPWRKLRALSAPIANAARRLVPHSLRFLYIQRVKGFDAPTEPRFDPLGYVYFLAKLNESSIYLEYGSGGSTFLAAQKRKRFISVDSDRYFLRAVENNISAHGFHDAETQKYIHADIGLTKGWGYPAFKFRTKARLAKWVAYSNAPWSGMPADALPDLILVDGRFRVACALATIKNLQGNANWELLVDDYPTRPHYKEIERFATLDKVVGKMAIFKHKPDIDQQELGKALERYSTDWR